jgi:hypothetical protein
MSPIRAEAKVEILDVMMLWIDISRFIGSCEQIGVIDLRGDTMNKSVRRIRVVLQQGLKDLIAGHAHCAKPPIHSHPETRNGLLDEAQSMEKFFFVQSASDELQADGCVVVDLGLPLAMDDFFDRITRWLGGPLPSSVICC